MTLIMAMRYTWVTMGVATITVACGALLPAEVPPPCVELIYVTGDHAAVLDSLRATVHPDSLRVLPGDSIAVRYIDPATAGCEE